MEPKRLRFVGSSLTDLRKFPAMAKRSAGFNLRSVQNGLDPADWKPMLHVGRGVKEIRIHSEGEWRILYVAIFKEAVYVLHAFGKKTRKTSKKDLDLARTRYKQVEEIHDQEGS